MSSDANKADEIFNLLSLICILPLQLIVNLYFLWSFFGWALLTAAIFTVFSIKLNKYFSSKGKELRKEKERLADVKKNLLGEVLNNIRVLKLFGWEEYFSTKVQQARDSEM